MSQPQKLPSNKRIARQKKAQAGFSLVGGTLGLAALASRGKAARIGSKVRYAGVVDGERMAAKASKWKDRSTALTTAGAGVGGVGAYNFASYTNADAKKQQRLKKNLDDPFEINKLGGPKFRGHAYTIHERDEKSGEQRTFHPTDLAVHPNGKSLILRRNKYKFSAYSEKGASRVGTKGKEHYLQDSGRVKIAPKSAAKAIDAYAQSKPKGKKKIAGYNVSVEKANSTSAFGIDHGY